MSIIHGENRFVGPPTLIEILWSDLTYKQQSSRIYRSAGIPVLLLSTLFYSEVAQECLQSSKSRNFVAWMSNQTTKFLSVQDLIMCTSQLCFMFYIKLVCLYSHGMSWPRTWLMWYSYRKESTSETLGKENSVLHMYFKYFH